MEQTRIPPDEAMAARPHPAPGERRRELTRWSRWLAPAVTGFARHFFDYPGGTPNGSRLHPELELEHWTAVKDGKHNLTTDMILWRDRFYLVHASSPWHIASEASKLVVWESRDARDWRPVAEFTMPGGDIRDPKLAVIGDRLFLYVLRNVGFVAEPSATSFTVTDDGKHWTELTECEPHGWLFWRVKPAPDGRGWYVPAYWHKHGKSILLHSVDGVRWKEVSVIHEGDFNDETDIELLPDGSMLATARLEMSGNPFGHRDACTLVAVARPPYTEWARKRCAVTRLDGPNLFRHGDTLYAAGRHHVDASGFLRERGSFLGRKRTALYKVEPAGLTHLTDLPSNGDTGYPGLVVQGDTLYVCYYTNDIERDYRWLVGMFLPSEIRIAKLSLRNLERIARRS